MSSKIDRRLLDTNAAAMGGGVGLAVLESMFSLVQSQSVMNAAMVRDYQLSHPLVMESLAVALNEILDPYGDPFDDDDGVVVPIRRGRRGRKPHRGFKAHHRPPGPDEPTIRSSGNGDDDGGPGAPDGAHADSYKTMSFMQKEAPVPEGVGGGGGNPDVHELAQVLSQFVEEIKNAKPQDGTPGAQSTTTTTKTSEHVESVAQMEAFFTNFVDMMGKHLEDLSEVNKNALRAPTLMVT